MSTQEDKMQTQSELSLQDIEDLIVLNELSEHIGEITQLAETNTITKPKEYVIDKDLAFHCIYDGCNKSFKRQSKLDRHYLSHTGEKPFFCSFEGCLKSFSRETHVKRHEMTHKQEKPFACDHPGCDKSFYTKQHRERHKLTHTVSKPFSCEYEGCGASFTKQNQLQRHLCIHTGRKPYPCDAINPITNEKCTSEFDFPSQLKRHQKAIHQSEEKYFCGFDKCNIGFVYYNDLLKHLKTDHGAMSHYECDICKTCFQTQNTLTMHKARHQAVLTEGVFCTFGGATHCGKRFTSKASLDAHVKTIHLKVQSFECVHCKRTYPYKSSLNKHLKKCQPAEVAVPESSGSLSPPAKRRRLNEELTDVLIS